MEVSSKLKYLLNDSTFQEHLNNNDFDYCYNNITTAGDVTCELTKLLLEININPLNYMNNIPDYFLYYSDIREFNIPDNIISIGYYAFENCENLTNIIIPNSVRSIESRAFANCDGLTRITIPGSVASIGSSAFIGCNGLTNVTILDGVKTIGGDAFFGCTNLTSIDIPNSVISIGNDAFDYCANLTITCHSKITEKLIRELGFKGNIKVT